MFVNKKALAADAGEARAPMYQLIQEHFLAQITSGALEVGAQLPIETEIARMFGTSRATVQTAMSKLVHDGWITKQAGRGTFVADSSRSAMIDLDDVRPFEKDAAFHGKRVTYRLLSAGRREASLEVAERLGIDSGTVVFAFERLRLVNDSTIGMELRYFTPETPLDFPLDALDSMSTHDLIETYMGKKIGRMNASIRATVADRATGAKLGVDKGAPLLLRRHTMFSTDDEVILFGEAHYCEPFAFRYSAKVRG